MKKTVFTIGAVLLITSGFVSESFGQSSSGSGSAPPPPPSPGPTTGTAPVLLSGANKVSGTKTTVEDRSAEILSLTIVKDILKELQENSPGFCDARKKMSLKDTASCALKKDEPSSFVNLQKMAGTEAKQHLCAVTAHTGRNFYHSTTGGLKKFIGRGDANDKANSGWDRRINDCYTRVFSK
jgi:hypothetical protein